MAMRSKVLFLQLPQLDNDIRGESENVLLAAAYLQYAAEQKGEGRYYAFERLPEQLLACDNTVLIEAILDLNPAVIACSLYLWNIERTLRLMDRLRALRPGIKIILGGPEVADSHPFLFKHPAADAIVAGEGESVFPVLLEAFRTRHPVNYSNVAMKSDRGYHRGNRPAPAVSLTQQLPPPGYEACRPDHRGMAYLECSRGCPMHCTYCRYPQLRDAMSFLEPDDIIARVRALKRMGAREIRFVDPTFNSHPKFRDIIRRLALLNRSRRLAFFAELDAGRIQEDDAKILAEARFTEIEVGVQSRDPAVLKAVRRPTSLQRLDAGLRHLTQHRIKVTVDIMYGLPLQGPGDIRRSIRWALKVPRANVQCLQTLLLPGTELRECDRKWDLESLALPPYPVTRTSTLDHDGFRSVEAMIARNPRLRSDVPTAKFVARRLDLFKERIKVRNGQMIPPPRGNRRAYLFDGPDLFGRAQALATFISTEIEREPDCLFQFVLCPREEEPLDLLDVFIQAIRAKPSHLVDRYASVALNHKIASRRVMIRLPRNRALSSAWIREAEAVLDSAFF